LFVADRLRFFFVQTSVFVQPGDLESSGRLSSVSSLCRKTALWCVQGHPAKLTLFYPIANTANPAQLTPSQREPRPAGPTPTLCQPSTAESVSKAAQPRLDPPQSISPCICLRHRGSLSVVVIVIVVMVAVVVLVVVAVVVVVVVVVVVLVVVVVVV
jgi:hypothetical protein